MTSPVKAAILKAVANVKGQSAMARAIGIRPQAVQKWCKTGVVPADRVIDVEKHSGVHRHDLRPDIYPDAP